jgi:hypothetical protein
MDQRPFGTPGFNKNMVDVHEEIFMAIREWKWKDDNETWRLVNGA